MRSSKPLIECDHLEITPNYWNPETPQGRLAALVAYNLGDGTASEGRKQAAFYSQNLFDMEQLCEVAFSIGIVAEPKFKKGKEEKYDCWQVYFCGENASTLINAGAVRGKKVEQSFNIPEWVMLGSLDVKRAFLAALWGAEGTTPSLSIKKCGAAMKLPKMPRLSMSKRIGVNGAAFLNGLQSLMRDFGVETIVVSNNVGKNTVYSLYVSCGAQNVKNFFDNVGFLFAREKSFNSWLWSHYLGSYLKSGNDLCETVIELRKEGKSWDKVAEQTGESKGKVYNLAKRGVSRSPWSFPGFAEWVDKRYCADTNTLRVKITAKKLTGVKPVFNIRVDSPDHSYVLASGVDNFNSFETMSGRVYYAFDRNVHVGKFEIDLNKPLLIGQDFNVDPMCSAVMQWHEDKDELWIVDEIFMPSSSTAEVADEMERRYWRHFKSKKIGIYPDPAGGSRSSSRGESDLMIFRDKGIRHIYYRAKHPPVADRINAVNSMLLSASGKVRLRVNSSCKNVIDSLEQTIYIAGTREVNKKLGKEHMADAVGYPVEYLFPVNRLLITGTNR